MSSLRQQEEKKLAEKYEHFPSYKQCQSRALMSGLLAFWGGAIGTWIAMAGIKKYVNPKLLTSKAVLGVPLLTGVMGSYFVTQKLSKDCYSMWMVLEGKLESFPQDSKGS